MANKKQHETVTHSRARYALPEDARRVVDLVNSIPPDRVLPHEQVIYSTIESEDWISSFREKLAGVPQSFIDQCLGPESAYRAFRQVRLSLRKMANLAACSPADRFELEGLLEGSLLPDDRARLEEQGVVFFSDESKEDFFHKRRDGLVGRPGYSVEMRIAKDGRVEFVEDFVGQFLRPFAGVIADRVRICGNPNCRRLFYARQDNMHGCGMVRCRDVIRQRRHRQRLKDAQDRKRKKARK